MAAQAYLKLGEVSAESGTNKQNLGSLRWIHSCRAENGTNNWVQQPLNSSDSTVT